MNTDTIRPEHGGLPKYAASVVRVSYTDQVSADAQHDENTRKALEEGFIIPDHPEFRFTDINVSGEKRSRDGLDRFKQQVANHPQFKRVYMFARARAARWSDPRRLFEFELFCLDHGVLVRYIDEPEPNPDATPMEMAGNFLGAAFRNVQASAELQETRKRTRRGRRSRVKDGFFPGGHPPYGLERILAHLATRVLDAPVETGASVRREGYGYVLRFTDGPERQVIVRIFENIIAGESLRGIAVALNAESVSPPSARLPASIYRGLVAPRWTPESVREIVRNPIYMGVLIWGRHNTKGLEPVAAGTASHIGDEPIRHDTFVPDPPIDAETWSRAQAALDRNAVRGGRHRAGTDYILSGLVRCAHCGASFHGQRYKPQNHAYYYYKHYSPSLAPARCPYALRTVRIEPLHDFATALVREVLGGTNLRDAVVADLARQQQLIGGDSVAVRIKELRSEIDRRKRACQQATENAARAKSETARSIHEATADREGAEADRAKIQLEHLQEGLEASRLNAAHARMSEWQASDYLVRVFDDAPAIQRKAFVRALVQEVVVDLAAGSADFKIIVTERDAIQSEEDRGS